MPFPGDMRKSRRGAATIGARDAFVATVKQHDDRLRSLVFKLLAGDSERTEHVLVEVYAAAYERRDEIGDGAKLATWLYRQAFNASIDELRHVRPHPHTDTGSVPAVADNRLIAGLRALPTSQRLTLILVDSEGFSPAGAASILGVSIDRVAGRLQKARATMHEHLNGAPG